MKILNIIQGEYAVSADREVGMSTVLGSCIAACVFDGEMQIGGMNHFLLPEPAAGDAGRNVKYGAYLMELLVNDLLKSGASRGRLCAKLYGGSQMHASFGTVGERNIEFVRKYLVSDGITIGAENVGGCSSRRITFYPTTGKVELKRGFDSIDDVFIDTGAVRSRRSDVLIF